MKGEEWVGYVQIVLLYLNSCLVLGSFRTFPSPTRTR